jgi:oligosaccharyltransferase complex subunit epsilon
MCDCYVVFCLVLAALQFTYMKVAGDFPYNSFLAGFFCSIGMATLTACLRLQLESKRAHSVYSEYMWCSFLLLLVSFNYLG